MLPTWFQLDVLFTLLSFLLVVQSCKVKLISIHVKLYNQHAKTPAKVWSQFPQATHSSSQPQ